MYVKKKKFKVVSLFITLSIQVTANNIKYGEGGFGDPSSVNASTG